MTKKTRQDQAVRTENSAEEFESIARREGRRGRRSMFVQLLLYVQESRRWWILPVILALLMAGILIILGSTAAAPFIYTLF